MRTFAPHQSTAQRRRPASGRPPVTLSVNMRRRPTEGDHPAPLSHGHDFSRISVHARPASPSAAAAVAQGFSKEGSTQAPGPAPGVPAGPSPSRVLAPSLSLANDAYTDSGTTSHKNIAFNVSVPIPLDPAKFALVNKI